MTENEVKEASPFAKAEAEAKKAAPAETTEPANGRKVINEETLQDSNWINVPSKTEINKATPELKIGKDGYYNQDSKTFINKTTQKPFSSGLEDGDKNDAGEFILEGIVDGESAKIRLPSWELVYKMGKLVRHCKENNFTLTNQVVSFLRVNEGQENAGENWHLLCPSLKIKISGKDNLVEETK